MVSEDREFLSHVQASLNHLGLAAETDSRIDTPDQALLLAAFDAGFATLRLPSMNRTSAAFFSLICQAALYLYTASPPPRAQTWLRQDIRISLDDPYAELASCFLPRTTADLERALWLIRFLTTDEEDALTFQELVDHLRISPHAALVAVLAKHSRVEKPFETLKRGIETEATAFVTQFYRIHKVS